MNTMSSAHVYCSVCKKEASCAESSYVMTSCGRHVVCATCAMVFNDGVSATPQCCVCVGGGGATFERQYLSDWSKSLNDGRNADEDGDDGGDVTDGNPEYQSHMKASSSQRPWFGELHKQTYSDCNAFSKGFGLVVLAATLRDTLC